MAAIWHEIPDTASKTLDRIKAVFDFCQVQGYRTVNLNGIAITQPNPCDGVRAALGQHNKANGHHIALPYTDLPTFIQKLRTAHVTLSVKLALEFTIRTSMRASEVLLARWEEFDFDAKVWTVPAERLNEERGMKMGIEHRVPLSDRCVEILKLAKQ